ncbi:unnamed protein product [Cuscuta campestris]|uniref:CCHC-type domain-containing protein n=1 Tax=Cuscuta campestris TaxID=132261 RepID=A0A484NPX0_9ASTE|nr:unnamed protein product [Cuscuta campestris]
MVNNMDHGLPKFSLLGYDDWKIMMEEHLYALHDFMWMVLEDGPLKIQMENPERNPAALDVVQYIPKPKEKWDDRDFKKHNLDNVGKAAIFKTLDPITFSKIKHLKTAMEIWQGLGKLCEGSEDLRKQKIEVLLEKFKSFKMLPGESFDMLDERFHKILNDLASLNHVLSPKEKNVRLLRSLPTEWYTKATTMEEGRNLENYIVQGLLDELKTYEHELKKKKEEQVTPFPKTLMTTPRVPSSEGTCPRNCDTPSSSQPSSSKMENCDEEFAMMVKQFRKIKKFFKKADSVRRPTKGKPQVSDSPPESYLCYNCRKPGHWKSACPYPKVEKYGERERNEKKKKAMVAAESDESSSSSSDEEALICMERRAEKSNHEDRWTMSEDDTLCLMAKDDADQEVTSQTSSSSSYESIPTSENLFDQFKKMMEDFEEINLKHSSLTEENKLLSEENLKLTEGRKSQLNEITQLKAENESLSEKEAAKYPGVWYLDNDCSRHMTGDASLLSNLIPYDGPRVTFGGSNDFGLTKGLGNLVYKGLTIQAVSYVEGLNYNVLSISQFCDKGYSLEFCKDMASLKNISTNEVILTRKRIRNIYEVMWNDVKEACLISKDKDEEVNEGDRMKPTEFIPFRSLPLKTSQRNLDSDSSEPSGNFGQPSSIPELSNGDNSGNGNPVPIHPETPTTSVLQPEAELDQLVNPNQHNLRWLRDHPPQQIIGDIQSGVRTRSAQQNLEAMLACFISQKLESKCSSPAFYQNYLEMIAAQELAEFLQMKIRLKYEAKVLEFYKNGEVKIAHSKKDPQRTFQVIKSTVGGRKVKLSQKNLGEKLHLPNSGVEIGRFPVKNLDWNIIGISGQAPSGPAKKADLNNDYKLVLELVIACLECGSGGHADDITQEKAFIINALITKSKNLALVNLEEAEEVSVQGELQRNKKRKLSSLSTSGYDNPDKLKEKEPAEEISAHNRSPQQLEEEIPQVQSLPTPSPQPQMDDADNQFWQLYYDWRAWKVGNSAEQLLDWDQQLKNEKIIKKCLGIPVNHSCEEILDDYWVWQRNHEDLHLEYLANSPNSEFEVDDEDPSVYKPVFSKAIEEQVVLTSEAQAVLEATAEDFQIFPETSPAFETVLTEAVQEKAASPPQEQNQKTVEEEEFQQLIQSQVLETLTTPCEISNPTETEIPEKSAKIPEQSTFPETNEEEQAIEVQRNSGEAEKETQMAELEVSKTPIAIFEEQNEAEDSDSLSRYISNFALDEAEGESERTLKITDEEDVQEDAESLPMQLFQRTPSSHQVTNFHFHSSSTPTLLDEIPEIWTKKVQGLIESALASQHASFRQDIEQMEARYTKLIEKSEEKHSADLKEISKSVHKTLEIISLLSKTVSNTMEIYASDNHLQLKEINKVKEQIASVTVVTKDYLKVIIDNQKEAHKLFRLLGTKSGNRKMEVILQQHSPSLIPELPIAVKEGEVSYIPSHLNMTNLILEAQQRNPENSAHHLSSSGLDVTEAVGTIAAHFSDDNQTKERRNNIRRIKELC